MCPTQVVQEQSGEDWMTEGKYANQLIEQSSSNAKILDVF